MDIICPISLVRYNTPDTSYISKLAKCPHPIFSLSTEQLNRHNKQFTKEDKPLILLAYLNNYPKLINLETVDIKVIRAKTIASINFSSLYLLSKAATVPASSLPRFHATTETINAFPQYLIDLHEAINSYEENTQLRITLARKQRQLESIEAKILNKNNKNYPATLTKWLFSTISVPALNLTGLNKTTKQGKTVETLSSYWETMFKDITKDPTSIFHYSTADFDELYNHIANELENTSKNSQLVYDSLNAATHAYKRLRISLQAEPLIENNSSKPKIDYSHLKGTDLPLLEDYPNKVEYMKARAKWTLANRAETKK